MIPNIRRRSRSSTSPPGTCRARITRAGRPACSNPNAPPSSAWGCYSSEGGQMKYRKILLAYNGSQEGKRALLETADLAGFLNAETHLLAVASMPPSLFLTEGFVPEELLEEEKKRTQAVLDEGIRTLRERGFNAAGQLAVGEPVEEICRSAKSLGVDLIVVGHNQNTSFAARWWKGSVGASLLDYAPCSILIALSKV